MSADSTRVVCDAGVLVADLLVGASARATVDILHRHDWLTLVGSEPLLADAEAVVGRLTDESLAADWREAVAAGCALVEHPAGDHPGLAAAYRGGAAHLVSFDETLTSSQAGVALQRHTSVSVRTPDAFTTTFDPVALYEASHDGDYPGPDRPPRA